MIKRLSLLLFIFMPLFFWSCKAAEDITGIYVHYNGEKVYYTLNVKKTGHSTVQASFDGVPLDLIKRLPWSMQCDGQIQGEFLICAKNRIKIMRHPQRLDVTYPDGKNQVFINSLEEPDEIIKNYD